jgi:hypothetical protein
LLSLRNGVATTPERTTPARQQKKEVFRAILS